MRDVRKIRMLGTFTGRKQSCLDRPSACEVSRLSRLTGRLKKCYPQFPLLRKPEFPLNSREKEEGAEKSEGGERENATKWLVPAELFGKITKQQLHMPHINYV